MSDVAKIKIVNTALAQLGKEPVADLSAQSLAASVAVVKLLRHLPSSHETVLRRHGWLCALEYATLAPVIIAGYVNWKYPSVYQLPGDGLRVWTVYDPCAFFGGFSLGPGGCGLPQLAEGRAWEAGTFETPFGPAKVIRSGACAALPVAYVRRASYDALDEHVRDAVAYDLAARAAYDIKGDLGLQGRLEAKAEQRVMLAISVDSSQEGEQAPLAPSIPAALRARCRY